MSYRLDEIARRFGLELRGDGQRRVIGVCSLRPGSPERLTYLSDPSHADALAETRAGAVILSAQHRDACPTAALVAADPKLAYARVAALFAPPPAAPGVHPSAVIDAAARVADTASVGANAVVESDAVIGPRVRLDPGCVVGAGTQIGEDGRIGANACVGAGVRIGVRVDIGAGAVIGGRGFGLVRDGDGWRAIPQLGSVIIGDDVEIGAGTTIDRGAIEDTVLEDGVKLDDQVHIAHNCVIGAHTVIAGCTGIAGSSRIGRQCMIGGGVGIGDHVTIADGVVLTGASQVPSDIERAGVYSSTLKAMPAADWRKRLALLRKLDRLQQRLRRVEQRTNKKGEGV